MRCPASTSYLERHSCPGDRGPNSSSLYPPQAAVVAVALFSRFSHLLLRSRLYALAEREVLLKRNTIGGAVNRRSTKMRLAKRLAFLCFSYLRLRRRFHLSAELHALRKRNTSCEAASRRNEKKAFSAAASFFPFRQLLRDYQGRAALDSCLPRLESSGCFSGSLLARKRELSLTATAFYPAPQAREGFSVLFWQQKRTNRPPLLSLSPL